MELDLRSVSMNRKLGLPLCAALLVAAATPVLAQAPRADLARWEAEAKGITIIRDDWGIAHVHGKTDADAVFGMIYAQAEDDFNRVETNYINSQGRLAEAEGEPEIWRDLRMKLFINPDSMKAQYAASPTWLKKLMNAWADGLNFYLAKHPEVQPRVITHFEPWMALTFSEGSIGGDIEKVNLERPAGVLRRATSPRRRPVSRNETCTRSSTRSRADRTASRSRRRTRSERSTRCC